MRLKTCIGPVPVVLRRLSLWAFLCGLGKEALSHHVHHGNHGGQGHSNFVSADFGEQMAAGGAAKLNSRRAEYWDKWIERSNFLPLWQLGFLFACFIAVAAFPIVVEDFVTNHVLPQAQAESQTDSPAQYDAGPNGNFDKRFARSTVRVDR